MALRMVGYVLIAATRATFLSFPQLSVNAVGGDHANVFIIHPSPPSVFGLRNRTRSGM
jgi:hypothetical protein